MIKNAHFSRRTLLSLGALSAGALLLPKSIYADEGSSESTYPNCIATLTTKDGELLACNHDNPLARNASEVQITGKTTSVLNADGSVTSTFSSNLLFPGRIGQSSKDSIAGAYVEIEIRYYQTDGNICITQAVGTAETTASYASFQGSRGMAVHQGIAGSAKCHKEATFTSKSNTITTGWDPIPYVATDDSNMLVLNGGECTAEVYVSGMGEAILRAAWTI